MKILILIPAYNEAKALKKLLPLVQPYSEHLLIIDDGSQDDTTQVAKDHGAHVLTHPHNMGKGAACRSGLVAARNFDFDAVIMMDSDGQHAPEDIPHFLKAYRESHEAHKLILGNRMSQTHNMPFVRRMTNRLLSWLMSTLTHQNIPDSQCGFRFIHRELFLKVDYESNRFDAESEILIRAARHGFKIGSCPIQTIYGDQYSKINPFKDTLRFIRFYSRHLFWSPKIKNTPVRDLSIQLGREFTFSE